MTREKRQKGTSNPEDLAKIFKVMEPEISDWVRANKLDAILKSYNIAHSQDLISYLSKKEIGVLLRKKNDIDFNRVDYKLVKAPVPASVFVDFKKEMHKLYLDRKAIKALEASEKKKQSKINKKEKPLPVKDQKKDTRINLEDVIKDEEKHLLRPISVVKNTPIYQLYVDEILEYLHKVHGIRIKQQMTPQEIADSLRSHGYEVVATKLITL